MRLPILEKETTSPKLSESSPTELAKYLTYCTNIHPGESWSAVFENLQTYTVPLKQRLCPDRPFGIGLRLSNVASQTLITGERFRRFKIWLAQQGLYVFTLNGFPYGSFHAQVVKDAVYAPDWTQPARLDYTLRLTQILAELLPVGIEGSISTLPLSYKPWQSKADSRTDKDLLASIYEKSVEQIVQVVAKMAFIERQTGKVLHLDIEPEPDGLIENTEEMAAFFAGQLVPVGCRLLKQQGFRSPAELLYRHVRVCYDACHFAVEYENPIIAVSRLQQADIQIGKLQLSSAIKALLPAVNKIEQREALRSRLSPFAESTYLHQVIARLADGGLLRYPDLAVALPSITTTETVEWRTHFHVPIFLETYQTLTSTQDHLIEMLALLPQIDCGHLEIETYTWDVLPAELALDVVGAIEREYRWVLEKLLPDYHRLFQGAGKPARLVEYTSARD